MPKYKKMRISEYAKLRGLKNQRFPSAYCKAGRAHDLEGVKSARKVKPPFSSEYWELTVETNYLNSLKTTI
jgi:hypothetical protein